MMNEAIGMLNAGKSATVVLRHLGYTRKTIVRLQRRFSVIGKVTDRPRSGRQPVTPFADDRCMSCSTYITGRQYGILPLTVRNRLRQNVQLFVRTDRTSVEFSPEVIEQEGRVGAAVTCTSDVLVWIWVCLTLAIPTDAREFIAVGESVLPMRASLSGTLLEVI